MISRLRPLAKLSGITAVAVFASGLLVGPLVTPAQATETGGTQLMAATPTTAAIDLFNTNKLNEAKAALTAIVATEPKNAEALFYLGWTALRLNQTEESIRLLEKATTLDANKSRFFEVLGNAYSIMIQRVSIFSKLGWAKKCLAAYDRGVALDPDNLGSQATPRPFLPA